MAQLIEESLLQAIKKDDIKAFNALTEKARCGAYRLGRFPVLSLLYLYNSRKIISAYEEKYIKITSYEVLSEPAEISKVFSSKAGKCLRLYLSEAVSPLEMLLILDKISKLRRIYPSTKPSSAIKERLKLIYSIKYSLSVKFEGDGIIIDRRPLSYREKKNIATACLCFVSAVTLAVGVPLTVDALIPKPVEGEVTELSHIDFNSDEEYTLKRDISLPESFSVEQVNCKITGEGCKLILGKGVSLGELNGKISDVTIESTGGAIFTSVSETAEVKNVTVNVTADVASKESTAFVALTNYGTFDEVTVNVSGKLNALDPSSEAGQELTFGGIVQTNSYKVDYSAQKVYSGVIKNCTVNYSQFALAGEVHANATFGGVAGINASYLQDCTVTGGITSDTFDLAGICTTNSGLLSGNVNEANLSQTSADTDWNPIVCGIVITNAYAVENCENRGNISSVSTCGEYEVQEGYENAVAAAGVAYLNRGTGSSLYILNSANYGNVECGALYRTAYCAGVCVSSNGIIQSCKNGGAVTAKAENGNDVNVGGITALSYGDVTKCVNEGSVFADGSGVVSAGGISAHSRAMFSYCISKGDITVKGNEVCAGGIFGYSETLIYYYVIYLGRADYCLSESKISVTAAGEASAYVGGIAGLVREVPLDMADATVVYYGGGVTNCCFAGELEAEAAYVGGIVGGCGKNIYESNSCILNGKEQYNFDGNSYVADSYGAFGSAVADGGSSASPEDKGAASVTPEEMKNSDTYKQITDIK